MTELPLRQILYRSHATEGADVHQILEQSRHNNALDGITGLLWSDGARFLQVIEGPEPSIVEAFTRIGRDRRHRDLELLSDRRIESREFGYWSMALRDGSASADEFDLGMQRRLEKFPEALRAHFPN
ncbi:BLUF domain-containing protein [Sphingomonas sp. 1P06PA]|uniref:BLUF domain-containing protein n=1 Tax=Sphingomonas sp. 1P06PA TaxID=554121 RepID=UPI0039A5A224